MKNKTLTIIGSTDTLDLPEMDILNIPAKIDTGANTSSLHCSKLKLVEVNGVEYLYFKIKHPKYKVSQHFKLPKYKEREVRSSNGISSLRFSVKTKVLLFGKLLPIEFTLSDREKMQFPILLGKRFLQNRFLVDVAQKELNSLFKKSNEYNNPITK